MRTAIVIVMMFCLMSSAWAAQYDVQPMADGLALDGGAFAWSPDGARAGWIADGAVVLYDIAAQKKLAAVSGGYSRMLWAGGAVYAIRGRDKETSLSVIDPVSGRVEREIPLGVAVSALYGSGRPDELILLWESFVRIKLGMDVNYALYALDLKSGSLDKRYTDYRIGFGRNMNERYYRGWAGVSPIETQALLIDYISPPALMSYMRFTVIDYLQNTKLDVGRSDILELTSKGSWSPDGSRVALGAGGSGLVLVDIADGRMVVHEGVSGLWPAWSPAGDRIYFGGMIMSPDGKMRETLLNDASSTIAWWSTDGARLAVVDGKGTLRLISGFNPEPSGVRPDARRKLLELKGLLIDGLISRDEYDKRKNSLLHGAGKGNI